VVRIQPPDDAHTCEAQRFAPTHTKGSILMSLDSTLRDIDRHSSAEDKIRLFRSLFRGREDVYPRRFESRKTGKSGYAPACANEWVKGICEKPRINCRLSQSPLPSRDR
jgi:hypothetical protein